MKIYKKLIASILTMMMIFAQVSVNVFADNEEAKIPLDIVLVLDVSGSMDDPIGNSGVKRIKILQDSINQFIEAFATSNSNKSDKNKQSRISIIKFAGKKCDPETKEGNDTYLDGAHRYNYTQIVSHYFTVTNENKNQLKDKVNAISPAGATRSDYGMELAQSLINGSVNDNARKNAKRVVLFLTDGNPTDFNSFNGEVANGAIKASKEIKKYAEVYSIGMFTETDPSITGPKGNGNWTEEVAFNAYMHGVSSNYPDAVDYKTLGDRANDSGYYMGVKNSNDANVVFSNIIKGLFSMSYPKADYSKVDNAIANVPSDLNNYTEESVNVLQIAVDAVIREKDITEQDIVDSYAEAINKAITGLVLKGADYTKVDEAITKANALNKDNYVDFTKVTEAINAVKRDKKITQQSEVDAMANAINAAVGNLVLKGADYTEVNNAIAKVPSDLENYTEETVRVLQDALKAVKKGKNITEQETVNNYADAINAAINGLKLKPADYSKVQEAKEKVPSDLSIYTDETVNVLQNALKAVKEGKNITEQETVNNYAEAINNAIAGLVLKGADYTKVNEAITKANALNKDNYVDFTKVTEAINAVERNKNIIEQVIVDGYAEMINNAIAGLVLKGADYTKVNEAITKANTLNKDNYVDFTKVTEAINAVNRDKKITQQSEVDDMAKVINAAIDNLILKGADYTKVNEAIAKANMLNKDDYVDFTKVIEAINAVDRNKNITEQAIVDDYAKSINNAIDELVKKKNDYKIIDGANSVFIKKSGKIIALRINHEFTNNIKVAVDEQEIDKANYQITEGSTIVTFNDEYLNTLTVGTHVVKIIFIDGTVTTYLTIKDKETISDEQKDNKTPTDSSNKQETVEKKKETKKVQTGDNTNSMMFISLFSISLLGIYCFVMKKYIC